MKGINYVEYSIQNKVDAIIYIVFASMPSSIYYCKVCDYFARDGYNMKKHIHTRKHTQMCIISGMMDSDVIKIISSRGGEDIQEQDQSKVHG